MTYQGVCHIRINSNPVREQFNKNQSEAVRLKAEGDK